MPVTTSTHTYKSTGSLELTLEVDRPDVAGPLPVLIIIHGGSWSHSDASYFAPESLHLAATGLAGVRINYQKADIGAKLADTLDDLRHVMDWLRQNAAEFGLDLDRIAVMGNSAGAHLSALMALQHPEIRAHIGIEGIYDLWPVRQHLADLGVPIAAYFAPLTEDHLRQASPIYQIRKSPPVTLLMHGAHDPVAPPQQSLDYGNALFEHGGNVRVLLYPGEVHEFTKPGRPRYEETLAEMELFLTRVFQLDNR